MQEVLGFIVVKKLRLIILKCEDIMKIKSFVLISFILLIFMSFGLHTESRQVRIKGRINVEIINKTGTASEIVTLGLKLSADDNLGNLNTYLMAANGAQIVGDTVINAEITSNEWVYDFEVKIPSGDTVAIHTIVYSDKLGVGRDHMFLFLNNDEIETYEFVPAYYALSNTKEKTRHGYVLPGEHPELDSLYGTETDETRNLIERDSVQIIKLRQEEVDNYKIEQAYKKLHDMEKDTLWDKPKESYIINGVLWEREYGEQYFHEAKMYTDEELLQLWESQAYRPDTIPDDQIFYLYFKNISRSTIDSLEELLQLDIEINENHSLYFELTKLELLKLQGYDFKYLSSDKPLKPYFDSKKN